MWQQLGQLLGLGQLADPLDGRPVAHVHHRLAGQQVDRQAGVELERDGDNHDVCSGQFRYSTYSYPSRNKITETNIEYNKVT